MRYAPRRSFLSLLLVGFLPLAALAAQPLRLSTTCEACQPAQLTRLDNALRASVLSHGLKPVAESEYAPRLELVFFPGDSAWGMAVSVESPRGQPLMVSQEELQGGFEAVLRHGLDSAVVETSQAIEEAIARAKAEKEKRERK